MPRSMPTGRPTATCEISTRWTSPSPGVRYRTSRLMPASTSDWCRLRRPIRFMSVIAWALITVATLKYVLVVMRADKRGEGGVLALMALVARRAEISPRRRNRYIMLGMAGAALFYGDCLLTPAVSVLGAIEGLNVATPAFEPLVVPLALGVIVARFAVQHVG